mgnify:FL=1
MHKVKVVFLGSRPLGRRSIDLLEKIKNVEIVGCITQSPSKSSWWDKDPHDYVADKYPGLGLDD